MAALIRRNKVFFTQLRQMHTGTGGYNVPSFNIDTERKAFLDVLPEVINSVVTSPKLVGLPEVASWTKKLLEYMLGGGKLGRGLMVSIGYRMFEEPEHFSEEKQHSARVLGWCSEMVQAKLLVYDDIMDGASIRRGKPCWHLHQNVGLSGINDAFLMYQCMFEVLNLYFGQTPIYADLIKNFNESVYRAIMGQHLDLWSTYSKENKNLDVFNIKLVNTIAVNKSGYYTFKLPIFTPLLLVKNGKKKATEELSQICLEFGRLMQCQDDYMDAYGDPNVTGKNGRDIQEGKCSWVAATALQHCSDAQRAIFKEHYGSNDPEHVKQIKQLYDELNLPRLYEQYERTIYDDIMRRIHALPNEGDRNFLLEVLKVSYKRVS